MNLKIKHKLFSAIILANLLVVLGVYALTNWSFSSSFRDYLDANQVAKFAPLNKALADLYKENKNWAWAKERQNPLWNELMEKYVFADKSLTREFVDGRPRPPDFRRKPPEGERNRRVNPDRRVDSSEFDREKPPLDPGNIRAQIFLADEQHKLLIGRRMNKNDIYWIDIKLEEKVIGYLGFLKATEITDELDQLLIKKLKSNLSWSLLLVIFISAMIAMLLARLMIKPILKLRAATKDISAGFFDKKIEINSRDEVGELSADFNRLALTLKNNLTARQQWISDISHELRTPVAILQGELEAMQDGIRDISIESINSLHQEVKRLSLLINDLHELSLSDNGALSYSFEKLDLVELIDKVIALKNDAITKANFSIKHQVTNEKIIINGDQHRLTQLFLNLLNNSLAYSHHGGTLDIRYLILADRVNIFWADSEPGVSDEQLARLFERLYRVESSRNRFHGGSGLGLSIVENIVFAHKGAIKAFHSEYGGVEFKITLPLA